VWWSNCRNVTECSYRVTALLEYLDHAQNEVKFNSNSPTAKKFVAHKKAIVKKMWSPRWQPRNGCECGLKAKILMMKIQCALNPSEMWRRQQKITWFVIIKFLPLVYLHSHFLATTLDFTSFLQWPSSGLHNFLQLGYFGLDAKLKMKKLQASHWSFECSNSLLANVQM